MKMTAHAPTFSIQHSAAQESMVCNMGNFGIVAILAAALLGLTPGSEPGPGQPIALAPGWPTALAVPGWPSALAVGETGVAHRFSGGERPDESLRRRLAELSRREADDAQFRREVERLVGVEPPSRRLSDRALEALSNPWVLFGFGAQALFMMRFVVQWIASERRKRSVVPVAFWWLSLMGGLSLFIYAFHRRDPVFMLGQGLGCAIYVRNLVLIARSSG